MINAIVDPWLLLPAAVMTILFCLMRVVYVNTGRCFKRIEAKSLFYLEFFSFFRKSLPPVLTFTITFPRSKSNILACECNAPRFVYDPCVQSGKNAKKRVPRVSRLQHIVLVSVRQWITVFGPLVGSGVPVVHHLRHVQFPGFK